MVNKDVVLSSATNDELNTLRAAPKPIEDPQENAVD